MTPKNKHDAAVILGKIKSAKKARSSSANGKDQRPHILKLAHFEKIFPHSLRQNEFKDKFPIFGGTTTYNPDYFCDELKCYIEVTTSKPNISEQGPRWADAIRNGLKLKIFWWEGEEITQNFVNI